MERLENCRTAEALRREGLAAIETEAWAVLSTQRPPTPPRRTSAAGLPNRRPGVAPPAEGPARRSLSRSPSSASAGSPLFALELPRPALPEEPDRPGSPTTPSPSAAAAVGPTPPPPVHDPPAEPQCQSPYSVGSSFSGGLEGSAESGDNRGGDFASTQSSGSPQPWAGDSPASGGPFFPPAEPWDPRPASSGATHPYQYASPADRGYGAAPPRRAVPLSRSPSSGTHSPSLPRSPSRSPARVDGGSPGGADRPGPSPPARSRSSTPRSHRRQGPPAEDYAQSSRRATPHAGAAPPAPLQPPDDVHVLHHAVAGAGGAEQSTQSRSSSPARSLPSDAGAAARSRSAATASTSSPSVAASQQSAPPRGDPLSSGTAVEAKPLGARAANVGVVTRSSSDASSVSPARPTANLPTATLSRSLSESGSDRSTHGWNGGAARKLPDLPPRRSPSPANRSDFSELASLGGAAQRPDEAGARRTPPSRSPSPDVAAAAGSLTPPTPRSPPQPFQPDDAGAVRSLSSSASTPLPGTAARSRSGSPPLGRSPSPRWDDDEPRGVSRSRSPSLRSVEGPAEERELVRRTPSPPLTSRSRSATPPRGGSAGVAPAPPTGPSRSRSPSLAARSRSGSPPLGRSPSPQRDEDCPHNPSRSRSPSLRSVERPGETAEEEAVLSPSASDAPPRSAAGAPDATADRSRSPSLASTPPVPRSRSGSPPLGRSPSPQWDDDEPLGVSRSRSPSVRSAVGDMQADEILSPGADTPTGGHAPPTTRRSATPPVGRVLAEAEGSLTRSVSPVAAALHAGEGRPSRSPSWAASTPPVRRSCSPSPPLGRNPSDGPSPLAHSLSRSPSVRSAEAVAVMAQSQRTPSPQPPSHLAPAASEPELLPSRGTSRSPSPARWDDGAAEGSGDWRSRSPSLAAATPPVHRRRSPSPPLGRSPSDGPSPAVRSLSRSPSGRSAADRAGKGRATARAATPSPTLSSRDGSPPPPRQPAEDRHGAWEDDQPEEEEVPAALRSRSPSPAIRSRSGSPPLGRSPSPQWADDHRRSGPSRSRSPSLRSVDVLGKDVREAQRTPSPDLRCRNRSATPPAGLARRSRSPSLLASRSRSGSPPLGRSPSPQWDDEASHVMSRSRSPSIRSVEGPGEAEARSQTPSPALPQRGPPSPGVTAGAAGPASPACPSRNRSATPPSGAEPGEPRPLRSPSRSLSLVVRSRSGSPPLGRSPSPQWDDDEARGVSQSCSPSLRSVEGPVEAERERSPSPPLAPPSPASLPRRGATPPGDAAAVGDPAPQLLRSRSPSLSPSTPLPAATRSRTGSPPLGRSPSPEWDDDEPYVVSRSRSPSVRSVDGPGEADLVEPPGPHRRSPSPPSPAPPPPTAEPPEPQGPHPNSTPAARSRSGSPPLGRSPSVRSGQGLQGAGEVSPDRRSPSPALPEDLPPRRSPLPMEEEQAGPPPGGQVGRRSASPARELTRSHSPSPSPSIASYDGRSPSARSHASDESLVHRATAEDRSAAPTPGRPFTVSVADPEATSPDSSSLLNLSGSAPALCPVSPDLPPGSPPGIHDTSLGDRVPSLRTRSASRSPSPPLAEAAPGRSPSPLRPAATPSPARSAASSASSPIARSRTPEPEVVRPASGSPPISRSPSVISAAEERFSRSCTPVRYDDDDDDDDVPASAAAAGPGAIDGTDPAGGAERGMAGVADFEDRADTPLCPEPEAEEPAVEAGLSTVAEQLTSAVVDEAGTAMKATPAAEEGHDSVSEAEYAEEWEAVASEGSAGSPPRRLESPKVSDGEGPMAFPVTAHSPGASLAPPSPAADPLGSNPIPEPGRSREASGETAADDRETAEGEAGAYADEDFEEFPGEAPPRSDDEAHSSAPATPLTAVVERGDSEDGEHLDPKKKNKKDKKKKKQEKEKAAKESKKDGKKSAALTKTDSDETEDAAAVAAALYTTLWADTWKDLRPRLARCGHAAALADVLRRQAAAEPPPATAGKPKRDSKKDRRPPAPTLAVARPAGPPAEAEEAETEEEEDGVVASPSIGNLASLAAMPSLAPKRREAGGRRPIEQGRSHVAALAGRALAALHGHGGVAGLLPATPGPQASYDRLVLACIQEALPVCPEGDAAAEGALLQQLEELSEAAVPVDRLPYAEFAAVSKEWFAAEAEATAIVEALTRQVWEDLVADTAQWAGRR